MTLPASGRCRVPAPQVRRPWRTETWDRPPPIAEDPAEEPAAAAAAGAGAGAGAGAPGTAGIGVGSGRGGGGTWFSILFLSLNRVFSSVVVFFFFFLEAVSPASPSGADCVCRSATSAASGATGMVGILLLERLRLGLLGKLGAVRVARLLFWRGAGSSGLAGSIALATAPPASSVGVSRPTRRQSLGGRLAVADLFLLAGLHGWPRRPRLSGSWPSGQRAVAAASLAGAAACGDLLRKCAWSRGSACAQPSSFSSEKGAYSDEYVMGSTRWLPLAPVSL